MIPAHAVPWPKSSPCGSSVEDDLAVAFFDRHVLDPPPTAGWSASMPLSMTATLTPAPVLPPTPIRA